MDISLIPATPISSVRGIGVADMASTSTSVRSRFRYSLCSTPNLCSSSMISRPSRLNRVSGDSSRWVPMTTSTVPSARPREGLRGLRVALEPDSGLTSTGNGAYRSPNVTPCCWASSVVGTSTATCLPSWTALKAARTAISVLP